MSANRTSQGISDDDLRRWRDDTPGCATRIHLNNAGASLMTRPVIDAIKGHIDLEAQLGGYEAASAIEGRAHEVYTEVAALIAGKPRNVALVENATVAVSQALSAFDFRPGDVLVTTHSDYTSNQLMYLALERRSGISVRRADDLPEGGVDPDSVRQLVRQTRCRLVAVTWVPTNSGMVQAAADVGAICRAAGVPYLLDACQAAGQLPIDVERLGCDFLAATARKFLRGPRGIGFLYVSDRMLDAGIYPFSIDMRGADLVAADRFDLVPDARRFENWEFAYALVLGLGEAVRYARQVGIEVGGGRARRLADLVRAGLADMPGVQLVEPGSDHCAIVTAAVHGRQADELVLRLRERGINTSASVGGLGPLAGRGAGASILRISPHYYNTDDEIGAALDAVTQLVGDGPSVGSGGGATRRS